MRSLTPAVLPNETDILQARAWTAAAAGDLPAARDQLDAAAELGEQIGDLIGASSALHGLARLGRAGHVAARLTALAEEIDGDLAPARAAYANAVAAGDSTALDQVASEFENLGANLYAAEARAEAAVLLRRAGLTRQTAAAEQKAARLLARCEGAATPTPNHDRAGAADSRRARHRRAGRGRPQQQADRQRHATLGPHRRKPPPARLREARRLRTPRVGRRPPQPTDRLTVERANQ